MRRLAWAGRSIPLSEWSRRENTTMPALITRRNLLASAAAVTVVGLSARLRAQEPVKAGFVYVGPVGDHGWSYRHDVGRKAVEEALGDQVATTFVENVSEGPDAERVIRQLAAGGNQIVFTTSFGFMNPTVRVAQQFPDVKFEHCTGYKTADNLAVYNARFYEGRTVIGHIAGHMSQAGTVGYIASFPIPEVVMGINAFGQASDMSKFAPNAQLTAIVDNWSPYYVERVKAVQAGTWRTHNIWWGLKEGMVEIAPYGPAVPAEVAQEADAIKNAIIAGELHPFAGPIHNQAGEQVVAEGQHLSDEEILRMDYYVQGIEGSLPT